MEFIIKDQLEQKYFCVKDIGKIYLYLDCHGVFKDITKEDNASKFYFSTKTEISQILERMK